MINLQPPTYVPEAGQLLLCGRRLLLPDDGVAVHVLLAEGVRRQARNLAHVVQYRALKDTMFVRSRDDNAYGLTGYGGCGFITSYTILTVYYCNRSNLALFNRY